MYKLNDFLEYFMSNHRCQTTSEGKVAEHISGYLEDVLPEKIDLITHKVKQLGFSICETTGGSFCSYYKIIQFPFRKAKNVAFHELGHAIDFISLEIIREPYKKCGCKTKHVEAWYSKDVQLSTGKTLCQTVQEEVRTVADELGPFLIQKFKQEVLGCTDKDIADDFLYGCDVLLKHRRLKNKCSHLKNKQSLEAQHLFLECDKLNKIMLEHKYFNPIRKLVEKTPGYIEFIDKYGTLGDMLSGYTDEYMYKLPGHSSTYMNNRDGFGCEFFAAMFCLSTLNKTESISLIKQFLPNSVQAYEELFSIIKNKML